jgi:hypothetical protein
MRLNWLAVLVAAVVHWLFGAVWFTLLSKPWQAGLRMSPDELQQYASHPNFWPYLISFACNFVIAYVIARVLSASGSYGLFRGIGTGILIGLVAAMAMVTEMSFEARASTFMLISALYPLIGSILMGMILGVWKPKYEAAASQETVTAK